MLEIDLADLIDNYSNPACQLQKTRTYANNFLHEAARNMTAAMAALHEIHEILSNQPELLSEIVDPSLDPLENADDYYQWMLTRLARWTPPRGRSLEHLSDKESVALTRIGSVLAYYPFKTPKDETKQDNGTS